MITTIGILSILLIASIFSSINLLFKLEKLDDELNESVTTLENVYNDLNEAVNTMRTIDS